MDNKTFTQKALRTETSEFRTEPNPRILHAAIGLCTESGELIDAVKKSTFYGRELDVVNVKEEAGDILWYLAVLFDELGTDFETEMKRVIAKLEDRFPDKFTEEDAFNRDLETERKTLESKF